MTTKLRLKTRQLNSSRIYTFLLLITFTLIVSGPNFAHGANTCSELFKSQPLFDSITLSERIANRFLPHNHENLKTIRESLQKYESSANKQINSCTGSCLITVAKYYLSQDRLQEALWALTANGPSSIADQIVEHIKYILSHEEIIIDKSARNEINKETASQAEVAYIGGIKVLIKSEEQLSGALAEAWAYALDQILGINLVPLAIARDSQENKYSIHLFISKSVPSNKSFIYKGYWQFKDYPLVYLLDFLLNQRDRHETNSLIAPSNKLFAIDNTRVEGVPLTEIENDFLSKYGSAFSKGYDYDCFPLEGHVSQIINSITYEDFKLKFSKFAPPEVVDFIFSRIQSVRK